MTATPKLVVRSDNARQRRWIALALVVGWLVSLAAAWWIGAHRLDPAEREARRQRSSRAEQELGAALETAKRRNAVLQRSDQISTLANRSLQKTLREREGDLAAIRNEIAFYQRLVGGGTGHGLRVPRLAVRPIGRTNAYGFRVLLTRNATTGETSRGAVTVQVNGAVRGKLSELGWDRLQQETGATPLVYAFKYFQELDSSLILPEGFAPDRIVIRARAADGSTVTESFAWQAALEAGGDENVWQ